MQTLVLVNVYFHVCLYS